MIVSELHRLNLIKVVDPLVDFNSDIVKLAFSQSFILIWKLLVLPYIGCICKKILQKQVYFKLILLDELVVLVEEVVRHIK